MHAVPCATASTSAGDLEAMESQSSTTNFCDGGGPAAREFSWFRAEECEQRWRRNYTTSYMDSGKYAVKESDHIAAKDFIEVFQSWDEAKRRGQQGRRPSSNEGRPVTRLRHYHLSKDFRGSGGNANVILTECTSQGDTVG